MKFPNRWMVLLIVMVAMFQINVLAFINPNFTPINLVEQSELIYVLEFAPADDQGLAKANVVQVIKGDKVETVDVDLLAGAFEAQGRVVMELLASGKTQAMLFAGSYAKQEQEMEDTQMQRQGYIHLAGKWLVVSLWEDDLWEMEKIDSLMLGTWAGSTDMLHKAVEYVMSDPYASVPVNCGVSWDKPHRLDQISGDVVSASAVDISQTSQEELYVAAKNGDRVYRWVDNAFVDVTAEIGLQAKSIASAWVDFDVNGTLDLVSYGEEGFMIHYQVEGGFEKKKYDVGDALTDGCVNLSVINGAIVAGGGGVPVVLRIKGEGAIEAVTLPAGDFVQAIRKNVACLVADMDGDGRVDILQPADGGGVLYRGADNGGFAPPMWVPIADDGGTACVGDYDGDGLLDVMVVGETANQIWQNLGEGNFKQTLDVSGEISYIAMPGGVVAQTGDINNDGRQDVLIGYGVELPPQLFFNRGFRSFGHARMIDIAEQKILPEASIGQQAACLGDFNSDGAMDMAIVLADGSMWVLLREVEGGSALVARAYVGLNSGFEGPVNVWATREGWSLGAWPIRAGEPGAFFGALEPGPIEIYWRTEDGEVKSVEQIVEDGPIRVNIGAP